MVQSLSRHCTPSPDRELYSLLPSLLHPRHPSLPFFFHPSRAPLSEGLGPREYESRGRLPSPLIQFISALSPLTPQLPPIILSHSLSLSFDRSPFSCFRALHSTVKGKVCNEISSERSPGDHYTRGLREGGGRWGPVARLLVIVTSNAVDSGGVQAWGHCMQDSTGSRARRRGN